ncbi:MAG TPA: DoxX family protein [Methylomirabilota bacterium]|nr:DoxX family protein [Methylomirabilota bacterium]
MEGYGALVLRVTLGAIFIMHAYLGFFVIGPAGMAKYFVDAHIPFPQLGAPYVILAHAVGGLCLILGVLARWAALANVPVFVGALYFFHLKQGFFMKPEGGYEYPLLLLGATVAQAMLGAGSFTLKK